MGISLNPVQTCDGCETERKLEIKAELGATREEIKTAALRGGWREVRSNKHLCADCIQVALKDS